MIQDKLFKIVLIGGGQLGSRYLQGIIASKLDLEIFVVDPMQTSHDICIERIKEVNKNFDFNKYHSMFSIENLPKKIDLVIISTQADIRFQILKNLLDLDHEIESMILEKILFQNIDDYDPSLELIKKNNIKCWVNCSRRTLPIYEKIKSEHINHLVCDVELTGGEWGFISNSIHFLDIISFFTENNKITISLLDKLIKPSDSISKRKGIYESSGELQGSCGNINFKFISEKASSKNHILKIKTDMSCIEIDEVNKRVTYTKNNIRHEENFTFPNLSEMAGQFVESILLEGVCALTDIETSIILHKPFILEINSYFKNNFDLDICPLT